MDSSENHSEKIAKIEREKQIELDSYLKRFDI